MEYFHVIYMIENMSMATINRNSGQSTTTFPADIWKMNLYDMYFSELGKEIIMSHRKLVGYQFPLLKVHICFEDVMCTRDC